MKVLIALLVGLILGAAGVFGYFYEREMQRYRPYQKPMAEQPSFFELSRFDAEELYALPLIDASGHSGKPIGDSRSRVIVIGFWASWCAPCIDEFGSFERLVEL